MSDRGAKAPVVTIDGPSGSGKGTISALVADALGFHMLDSGALYRLVSLVAKPDEINDEAGWRQLIALMKIHFPSEPEAKGQVWLNDQEVSRDIRTEECGRNASVLAADPELRAALLDAQRDFQKAPGLVADGRDMGTVVFPAAEVKIFLTASAEERARRRYKQLKDKGMDVSLAALSRDIEARDKRDSERSASPLKPADDAIEIDTSQLSIEQVVQAVLEEVAKSDCIDC